MLRDLDLYHSIIQGYYEPAKDVDEMQQKLDWLQKTPARLAELKMATHTASRQYSKSHLAKVWHQFYLEQAKEG